MRLFKIILFTSQKRPALTLFQSKLEEDERIARQAALQAAKPQHTVQTSEDVKTLSSSEFDKFLSERAAAGPQRTQSASNTQPRQMKNFIAEK